MVDNKTYKLYEKVFSLKELEAIHQFVVKKLNVGDLFKVRDRFEGNQFLINTTKKVFMLQSLFQYLNIENHQKIKPGFLNTINAETFTACKIYFLEFENDINIINLEHDSIYCIVNTRARTCILFSKDLNIEKVKANITENLNKCNHKAIYN